MGSYDSENGVAPALRYIPLSYSPAESQATALRLILTLFPHWEGPENKVEFVRFTDGITNTVRLFVPPSRSPSTAVPCPPALRTSLGAARALFDILD